VEVMFCEETRDVFCMTVTPACSEGALGAWRFQGGPRTQCRDKDAGKEGTSSWVNQRGRGVCMSVLELRRVSGKAHEGKPRSEPERGNPAFRDRRGACGNVTAKRAGLRPNWKRMDWPPNPKAAARRISIPTGLTSWATASSMARPRAVRRTNLLRRSFRSS
jgi:hypothetical protein